MITKQKEAAAFCKRTARTIRTWQKKYPEIHRQDGSYDLSMLEQLSKKKGEAALFRGKCQQLLNSITDSKVLMVIHSFLTTYTKQ